MLGKKRTKSSRQRGSSSHGWGHKKKHRGAGHRGGKGMSGSGKRGDQKKSMVLTKIGNSYFGKKGFKSIKNTNNNVLSLTYIENNFDKMVETGMIVKEKDAFVFNSIEHGYDKILGRGQFTKKMTIICSEISANAKKRVEDAKGVVTLKFPKEEKVSKEDTKKE